jgi:hypothetical protein
MRIRQIVFAAASLSEGRAAVASLFQLAPPFRDLGVQEFGIDNAVFVFGDQFIEVISPMHPGSACGRHLERHGDSGYMLLVQTDSLARERERFDALGVRHVWKGEHPDISAMHLHPKDVGAAIVSVDEPRPATAWRWGGPDWTLQPGAAARQRVRGLTLRSPDPERLARRWAEVLGRPDPVRHGEGWRVALTDGFADVVPCTPDRPLEGVAGFTLEVADMPALLARARAAGLPVTGDRVRLMGAELTITASR